MTKRRAPLTPHLALTTVAGLIGWDGAATICRRAERTLRDWSDPDVGAEISFGDALALDAAFLDAGGEVPPFLTCYETLLEVAGADRAATRSGRIERIAVVAEEAGEAFGALARLQKPGATHSDELIARREVDQLIEAAAAVRADLPTLPGDARA